MVGGKQDGWTERRSDLSLRQLCPANRGIEPDKAVSHHVKSNHFGMLTGVYDEHAMIANDSVLLTRAIRSNVAFGIHCTVVLIPPRSCTPDISPLGDSTLRSQCCVLLSLNPLRALLTQDPRSLHYASHLSSVVTSLRPLPAAATRSSSRTYSSPIGMQKKSNMKS